MKYFRIFPRIAAILVMIAQALCLMSVSYAQGTIVDMVVAVIDGEPLTANDLRRFIAAQGAVPPDDLLAASDPVRKFLQELLIDQMLEREAKGAGVTVKEDEIDAYIAEIRKQNNVNETEFSVMLESRGLLEEDYRTQVKKDIYRTRIVGTKIRSRINISDEQIKRYLKEHTESIPEDGSVRIHQISIKFDSNDLQNDQSQTTRLRLEEMRQALLEGGAWAEVGGLAYSDLGYVEPQDLRDELEEAVIQLELNKVSDIIEVDDTFYLISVSSRKEDDQIPPEIIALTRIELFEKEFQAELAKFFNEELPKKYHVEIKLAALKSY